MPTFNLWIRAEEFENVDVDVITREDVEVIWTADDKMFMLKIK